MCTAAAATHTHHVHSCSCQKPSFRKIAHLDDECDIYSCNLNVSLGFLNSCHVFPDLRTNANHQSTNSHAESTGISALKMPLHLSRSEHVLAHTIKAHIFTQDRLQISPDTAAVCLQRYTRTWTQSVRAWQCTYKRSERRIYDMIWTALCSQDSSHTREESECTNAHTRKQNDDRGI